VAPAPGEQVVARARRDKLHFFAADGTRRLDG
jgi:hypothetical protein